MENTSRKLERARRLLRQIEPALIEILRRAPEYGSCGIDLVLRNGEIAKTVERREETRQISKS